ncbi:MAG: metallophosphoesterase family protein [Clostridia bacterium]|nr:metallophosphoesterase family protein [Clostridia bacterium]
MIIGVLSDTHGLMRDETMQALCGCDVILHAGDVGGKGVLERLESIAPVHAVYGNVDPPGAWGLPPVWEGEIAGCHIAMAHRRKDLPSQADIFVYGHSHRYEEVWDGIALYLNPGSCGPRRFHLPCTLALLETGHGTLKVHRRDLLAEEKPVPAGDMRETVEKVVRDLQKGKTRDAIAKKYRLDRQLTEQIIRLYVTHPGVDTDGILRKMGL